MKRIDVTNYTVKKGDTEYPYEVKGSMVDVLMNGQLKLRACDLLERQKIGTKILEAANSVILEDAEYNKLKTACEALEGFSRDDVELVSRIMNPEEVPIPKE